MYINYKTDIQQAPWEFGKDKKKTRQVSMTVCMYSLGIL